MQNGLLWRAEGDGPALRSFTSVGVLSDELGEKMYNRNDRDNGGNDENGDNVGEDGEDENDSHDAEVRRVRHRVSWDSGLNP